MDQCICSEWHESLCRNFGGWRLSLDTGASWTAANTGLPTIPYIHALAVSGANLFAGTANGVFSSTDNGTSWTAINNGVPINSAVTAIVVSGTNLFAGISADSGWVFSSTDSGASWTAVKTFVNPWVYAFSTSGTNLFAGTGSGVFLSSDNGISWRAVDTGLTGNYVNAFAVSGTNLFAGTFGSGVWRRPLAEMIPSSTVAQSPAVMHEVQSYPNPFSQSTTIHLLSPDRGAAQVIVVNLLGEEVTRLFSGEIEAGEHSFTWDAHGVTPGMYECVIRMNDRVEQVPTILLR